MASMACTPDYSGDRLVDEPTGTEDTQTLLSYLNNKERANSDNPSFYYHRANVRLQRGMITEAVEDIDKAIGLNGEQARYYELKSRLMMERGSYTRALSSALKAQELGSRGPQTYIAMANAWASLENNTKALEALETAIALLPLDVDLYYLKSGILRNIGEKEESRKMLLKALAIDPGYSPALVDLTEMALEEDNLDLVNELISSLRKLDGLKPDADYLEAQLLVAGNDLDSASTILHELKNESTYRSRSMQMLGEIKLQRREYDSALYFARRLLELDSTYRAAYLINARSYDRKRFYQKSRENYQILLDMDSTDQLVQDELAKLDRKVAYLRKLEKERQERPQLIPLKPREITN